jgi:predicted anti-sigma-YlaC factor YlaD
MFSCRQAVRQTLDLLERRLSLIERVSRFSHLALCRHCRAHSRQIRGLLFVLKRPDNSVAISLPHLSPEARARIVAAVVEADRQ